MILLTNLITNGLQFYGDNNFETIITLPFSQCLPVEKNSDKISLLYD